MAAQHGYITKEYLLYPSHMSIGSGEDKIVVSSDISVSDATSINFSIFMTVDNVVLEDGEEIKFTLQNLRSGIWTDVGEPQACVKVTEGNGLYCILLNNGIEMEAMVLPLSNIVRLVASTGANSSMRITKILAYIRI